MKPPKRYKRFSFWLCVILAVACLMSGASKLLATNIYEQAGWWQPLLLALCFGLAAVLLYRRNREADRAWEQYVADRMETDRREEFERTHGRIFTKVAGVTFDNEDGSSRQRILKAAMAEECCGTVALERYEFKGRDAIRVEYDGECIGSIPRDRVAEILLVLDRITAGALEVSRFVPEDEDEETASAGGVIYRADLSLVYEK